MGKCPSKYKWLISNLFLKQLIGGISAINSFLEEVMRLKKTFYGSSVDIT